MGTRIKVNSSLPNLRRLDISACNVSEFPDIFTTANQLEILDLSHNKIHGKIPNWMWDIGKDTFFGLILSNNFLTGIIEQLPWENVELLDLRSNLLQGSLRVLPLSCSFFQFHKTNWLVHLPLAIWALLYILTRRTTAWV